MKRYIKIFLICCLFFCGHSITAQVEKYIDSENARMAKAQEIESGIERFISQNIAKYELSPSYLKEILKELESGDHMETDRKFSKNEIQSLLESYKKIELRALYFEQHPGARQAFTAAPQPMQLACANGGFELGTSAGYTFGHFFANPSTHIGSSCDNPNPSDPNAAPFTAPIGLNQFAAPASIITPGNEPLLFSLTPSIAINRVAAGNFSLKLNPTPVNPYGTGANDGETGDIASVSQTLTIDEPTLTFSFLLMGKVVPINAHIQPAFNYRLLDATGVEIPNTAVCIPLNSNDCRFSQANETRIGFNPNDIISYTPDWVCQTINTAALIDQQVTIEFSISDCEFRGHWATAYIDGICNHTCTPTWGSLIFDTIEENCPTEAIQVCGTFNLPQNATTMNTWNLTVLDANGNPIDTNGDTVVDNNDSFTSPTVTGNVFCFTINPSAFGTTPVGPYSFTLTATNDDPCNLLSVLTAQGGEVTFVDCCVPTLMESGVYSGNKAAKRSDWISTSEQITGTTSSVFYHAENFIEMTPGFETTGNPRYVAYIAPCADGFAYREQAPSVVEVQNVKQTVRERKINLVRIVDELYVYPNPSHSNVTVEYQSSLKNITILSIDGKTMFSKDISGSMHDIDVSGFANGIYLIATETSDGKIIQSKFVKN